MNSGIKLYELRINELTSDKLKNYGINKQIQMHIS